MVELYSVTPRIVAADEFAEITVKGKFPHSDFRIFKGEITVDTVGPDGLFADGNLPGYTCFNGFDMKRPHFEVVPSEIDANGVMRFRYFFRGEGKCSFRVRIGERILFVFDTYALRKEWLKLRPFRGDLHLHSGFSGCCGQKELLSPEYYAALNHSLGMDFIAISDHKQHYPSLKAASFADQCGGDFRVYLSEEVHLPDLHTIHNLSFGSKEAISIRLVRGNPEFDRALAKYLKIVPDFKDEYLRYLAASYHVVADFIHAAGGVNVFCHPFWRPFDRLFLPRCIRDYVLEQELFDCIELFGEGARNCDETHALYSDLCIARGRRIPAVGNNDAHNVDSLAINSTVIFAEKNEFGSLRDSLLNNLNVVVSTREKSVHRTSGTLELVSFYHFLRESYYPRHDEICRKEADLMYRAMECGIPDSDYDTVTNTPYAGRIGKINTFEPLTFTPDRQAFASVQAERSVLDREFWGN